MLKQPKLSLVIPAKNEARRIGQTLSQYSRYISNRKLPIELIVVVNGTADNTVGVVQKLRAKYPYIKLVETPYKSHKGGAVALGINQATGKYIGFTDADGSFPARQIHKLLNVISENKKIDGVIASRRLPSAQVDPAPTFTRQVFSFIFNLTIRVLFGLNYGDTQSGLKIFRANVARELTSKIVVHKWTFDVNLLLLAKYMNYHIEEVPVQIAMKDGSSVSIKTGLTMVTSELLRLKRFDIKYQLNVFLNRFKQHLRPTTKSQPRVLIFSRRYTKHPSAGGAEVYIQQVAERLVKSGKEVYVFTSRAGNLSDRDQINGVTIFRRGGEITVYIWAVIYYLLYYHRDMDFVIDIQTGQPFFTPLYSGKPKLMLVHHLATELWFKEFKWPFSAIGYLLEQKISPLVYRGIPTVTVSESTKAELQTLGMAENQIYLAYNAVQTVPQSARKSSTPLLVYIGRLKKYKRVDLAIRAMATLLTNHPTLRLTVAGKGEDRTSLEKLATQLGVANRVDFLGYVTEEEKFKLLKKATLHLMPSSKEGFGISILEAAQLGTPTVGFNVPGVSDAIRHNQTGVLANNYTEFVTSIDQLLTNDRSRQTMGKNAKQFVQKFDWQTTATIFNQLIDAEMDKSLLSEKVYPWNLRFGMQVL